MRPGALARAVLLAATFAAGGAAAQGLEALDGLDRETRAEVMRLLDGLDLRPGPSRPPLRRSVVTQEAAPPGAARGRAAAPPPGRALGWTRDTDADGESRSGASRAPGGTRPREESAGRGDGRALGRGGRGPAWGRGWGRGVALIIPLTSEVTYEVTDPLGGDVATGETAQFLVFASRRYAVEVAFPTWRPTATAPRLAAFSKGGQRLGGRLFLDPTPTEPGNDDAFGQLSDGTLGVLSLRPGLWRWGLGAEISPRFTDSPSGIPEAGTYSLEAQITLSPW